MIFIRSCIGVLAHPLCAARALATAELISSALKLGREPMGSPVAGLRTVNWALEVGGVMVAWIAVMIKLSVVQFSRESP
jgi:hypothetical protein